MNKSELREYRDLVLEAQELAYEIEQLRNKAQSRTWPDGTPRGSCGQDKLGSIVAKIADLCALLDAKHESILYRRKLIEKAIAALEPIERRLIRLRYVQGLSWERVAVEINYSWRETHRKHSKALQKLQNNNVAIYDAQ